MQWNILFFFNSVLLGMGLAMDAFSVSLANGLNEPHMSRRRMLGIAGVFAAFQALMPMTGWICVHTIVQYFRAFEKLIPWIALALLGFIGGKMLIEGIRGGGDDSEDGESCSVDPTKGRKLLILAVATSIDALAVGLSFSLLNINVWGPSTLIGVVCAVITALGLLAGKGLAHADIFGRRAELVGGCVLIGIGLKILYEHGVLS